jgi:hypothetical protein
MISTKFHSAIERWMSVDTWHTGHPSDDERFHEMLSVADEEGPSQFDVEGFIDVAKAFAQSHYPKVLPEEMDRRISDAALKA